MAEHEVKSAYFRGITINVEKKKEHVYTMMGRQRYMSKLKLVVMNNACDLGNKVNKHLKELNKNNVDYKVKMVSDRFSNGEGKVSVRRQQRLPHPLCVYCVGRLPIVL